MSNLKLLQVFVLAGVLALTACRHETPNTVYMPDMAYSPALKAQEPGAMRVPVAGTVSQNSETYAYRSDDGEVAGRELQNPLKRTKTVLLRGQKMFNTYCIVCHGPSGEGDGHIVPKFPRPPSLQSDKVMAWSDGRIFHTISVGQNLMPSYASQIDMEDRWAIIYYVRALQRAKHPSAEDLKYAEAQK